MRISLVLVLAAFFVAVAAADEEFVESGPYQLSFDLGASSQYRLNVNDSAAQNDQLSVGIDGQDGYAYIMGFPDEENKLMGADVQKDYIEYVFGDMNEELPLDEIRYYKRTFDGQEGVLGVLELQDFDIFIAVFSKEIPGHGSIFIEIGSMLPWDRGTESLLSSIKVNYTPRTRRDYGTSFEGSTGSGENYGTPLMSSKQYESSKQDISRQLRSPYALGNISQQADRT